MQVDYILKARSEDCQETTKKATRKYLVLAKERDFLLFIHTIKRSQDSLTLRTVSDIDKPGSSHPIFYH